uniref:Bifunctional inhibitor/plant lipid transfer protein/seed storage helical domain-containing protein n=1 Tax=Salix viminalis TaxID=40686 RepID=A0A6N2K4Z5_SALVM
MVRKETMLVAFTCLLVVASVAMCSNAAAAAPRLLASAHVNSPQGCRCCLVVGEPPKTSCAKSCCSNSAEVNCCIAT